MQSAENWNANFRFTLDQDSNYVIVGTITGYPSGRAELTAEEYKNSKVIDHIKASL